MYVYKNQYLAVLLFVFWIFDPVFVGDDEMLVIEDVVTVLSAPQELVSDGDEVSAFNEGRFAGLRADGTFPKLCIPCLRGAVLFCVDGSKDSP